jgi:two-component system sensor histidine kinase DesK
LPCCRPSVLRVLDDGKLRSTDGLQQGNGLAGMRERVAALGGHLSLQAGAGLTLELHVPSGASA